MTEVFNIVTFKGRWLYRDNFNSKRVAGLTIAMVYILFWRARAEAETGMSGIAISPCLLDVCFVLVYVNSRISDKHDNVMASHSNSYYRSNSPA